AADRPRRRVRAPRQGTARRPRAQWLHGDHDHTYPGSGGTHGRPDRRDRLGKARRRRHPCRTPRAERQQRHQPRRRIHCSGRRRGRRGMSSAALTWFARHEIRLAWREWLAMMTAGRRFRKRTAIVGLMVVAAILHLPAYAVVGRFADLQPPLDKSTLIVITTTIFLAWALLLSPPFVDVLVIGGGPRWLAAYGVVITIGLSAAAMAVAITIALFRTIGASRTRLVAQILAAIIGAGFVIALQIAAIMSYGTLSRFAILTSDAAATLAPDIDSMVWWPARAAFGEAQPLLLLLAGGFLLLGAMMAIFSPRFADTAIAVSANSAPAHRGFRTTAFRKGSRQRALRSKEFLLLRRDPWLVSQTL